MRILLCICLTAVLSFVVCDAQAQSGTRGGVSAGSATRSAPVLPQQSFSPAPNFGSSTTNIAPMNQNFGSANQQPSPIYGSGAPVSSAPVINSGPMVSSSTLYNSGSSCDCSGGGVSSAPMAVYSPPVMSAPAPTYSSYPAYAPSFSAPVCGRTYTTPSYIQRSGWGRSCGCGG